jgi:copper(I)-binding protein
MSAQSWRLAACAMLSVVAGCRRAEVGASAEVGRVRVSRAVAWTMEEARSATVGFALDLTAGPDTLVAVTSSAGRAALHETMRDGRHGMHEIPSLPLAAGRTMVDGRSVHVMVEDLATGIPVGGTLPLALRFARAGTLRLDVPVLRFSEALTALGR